MTHRHITKKQNEGHNKGDRRSTIGNELKRQLQQKGLDW